MLLVSYAYDDEGNHIFSSKETLLVTTFKVESFNILPLAIEASGMTYNVDYVYDQEGNPLFPAKDLLCCTEYSQYKEVVAHLNSFGPIKLNSYKDGVFTGPNNASAVIEEDGNETVILVKSDSGGDVELFYAISDMNPQLIQQWKDLEKDYSKKGEVVHCAMCL